VNVDMTPVAVEAAKHLPEIIAAFGVIITSTMSYFAGLFRPSPDCTCHPGKKGEH
jgi:hypothetical protein